MYIKRLLYRTSSVASPVFLLCHCHFSTSLFQHNDNFSFWRLWHLHQPVHNYYNVVTCASMWHLHQPVHNYYNVVTCASMSKSPILWQCNVLVSFFGHCDVPACLSHHNYIFDSLSIVTLSHHNYIFDSLSIVTLSHHNYIWQSKHCNTFTHFSTLYLCPLSPPQYYNVFAFLHAAQVFSHTGLSAVWCLSLICCQSPSLSIVVSLVVLPSFNIIVCLHCTVIIWSSACSVTVFTCLSALSCLHLSFHSVMCSPVF